MHCVSYASQSGDTRAGGMGGAAIRARTIDSDRPMTGCGQAVLKVVDPLSVFCSLSSEQAPDSRANDVNRLEADVAQSNLVARNRSLGAAGHGQQC